MRRMSSGLQWQVVRSEASVESEASAHARTHHGAVGQVRRQRHLPLLGVALARSLHEVRRSHDEQVADVSVTIATKSQSISHSKQFHSLTVSSETKPSGNTKKSLTQSGQGTDCADYCLETLRTWHQNERSRNLIRRLHCMALFQAAKATGQKAAWRSRRSG